MTNQAIQTQEVHFAGKVPIRAHVARPDVRDRLPAVIVVQEWWGLNENIKDIAGRLAREGYFAIAPDLYSRQGHSVTADPNVAGKLMAGLKKDDGVEDLLASVLWLKQNKVVRADRIGVIGFCMGGSYALLLPCASSDIKAAAPFYGEIPSDDRLQHLACPIFYAYGENDGWITSQEVDRLSAALRKFNRRGEVKIYPRCSHGFFNDTRKDVYRPAEAADAWQHALELFSQNLKI